METTSDNEQQPRIYTIRRSQHLGYGFVLGSEQPCIVKLIEPNGPSYGRLKPYDVILNINGIDVEQAPREKVVKMIQLSDHEIEITVRRATYEEEIRATNLTNPKFYMFNKSNSQQKYSDSLNENHLRYHQAPNSSPQMLENSSDHNHLNRLVTSIAQQQTDPRLCPSSLSGDSTSNMRAQSLNYLTLQPDRSRKVLKQKTNEHLYNCNGDNSININKVINGSSTLGRHTSTNKLGRHSPIPQRCKSSIDDSQIGRTNKKSMSSAKDQPMLKRSNTMRPIRPPAKVMEIFEVVIKIFFEDGQTKMLPYNQETTVGDVLETLKARLGSNVEQIKSYFGLAVTVNTDDNSELSHQLASKKPFHILDEDHPIMGIRKLPYAPKLRLLYRMIYPPSDITELYNQNKVAFDYLYKQSCNDLRLERFSPPLDPDSTIKLVALFLVEYVYSNHPKAHGNSKDPKVYIRLIKKDPGLKHFVPRSLARLTEDKKGKRILSQYRKLKTRILDQLKKNFDEIDFEPPRVKSTTNINKYTGTSFHELALPELQCSSGDHVKILFLNYLREMPCYRSAEREKPARTSISPIDRGSVGDCSSSMESVPRTSDSSPLIRQPRSQANGHPNVNGFVEQSNVNMVTRLAQINSMRSLSSTQGGSNGTNGGHMPHDQPDLAQTPSIESMSSITFNLQGTPSPQHLPSTNVSLLQDDSRFYASELTSAGPVRQLPVVAEPSPMPRHMTMQNNHQKMIRSNGSLMDRMNNNSQPIFSPLDELIKKSILPPPPPMMFPYNVPTPPDRIERDGIKFRHLTPVLTDRDLEGLRCPPPPK